MKYLVTVTLLLTTAIFCQSQDQDSIPPLKVDTVQEDISIEEIEMYASRFIPRRASLYAAIFPGAGQIYTKKYWKLPIVYGGFIALGLTIDFYNDLYKGYRTDIFRFLEDGTYVPPNGATLDQTRTLADNARRDRDFWIAMTGVFYLLQIADAHIDAHLKEFELNPNLQISLEPDVTPTYFAGMNTGFSSGVSIKLKF
jgi:hypothetical protein